MRSSRNLQPGVLQTLGEEPVAPPSPASSQPSTSKGLRHWVRRLGVLGFAFFLIKGLLWLTVPALLAYWAGQ